MVERCFLANKARMSMKTKDNDNMSLIRLLCPSSPARHGNSGGAPQTHATRKGRRGGENAPTSALPHSKNRRPIRECL